MTDPRTPPAWRRAFLRELARSGNAASAARACDLDPTFPYQYRRRNPAFAMSWERALAKAREAPSPRPSTACKAGAQDKLSAEQAGGDILLPGATPKDAAACPTGRLSRAAGLSPIRGAGEQGRKARRRKPILLPDETVRASKTGRCRIVRVRQGRWSAKVEAAFLAELTATANVNAAARAAGVTPQCVYMRRKLYPAFAAEWAAAVAEGFARIETLVVCAATTTLEPEPLPARAWEEPRMSMELAVKIWLTHRAGGPGARKQRLGGMPRREPDIEEVRQEILRKVAAMERAESRRGCIDIVDTES